MDRRKAIKHTGGAMIGALGLPSLVSVLASCEGSETRIGALTSTQYAWVSEAAEIIIPKTETAGAKDAKVPEYIDQLLQSFYDPETKGRLIKGIDLLAKQDLNEALLSKLDAEGNAFFREFKSIVLWGYFTSEVGMKQSLNYQPVPGRFDGCTTIDKNEKIIAGNR